MANHGAHPYHGGFNSRAKRSLSKIGDVPGRATVEKLTALFKDKGKPMWTDQAIERILQAGGKFKRTDSGGREYRLGPYKVIIPIRRLDDNQLRKSVLAEIDVALSKFERYKLANAPLHEVVIGAEPPPAPDIEVPVVNRVTGELVPLPAEEAGPPPQESPETAALRAEGIPLDPLVCRFCGFHGARAQGLAKHLSAHAGDGRHPAYQSQRGARGVAPGGSSALMVALAALDSVPLASLRADTPPLDPAIERLRQLTDAVQAAANALVEYASEMSGAIRLVREQRDAALAKMASIEAIVK